jgi:hypothetical protein
MILPARMLLLVLLDQTHQFARRRLLWKKLNVLWMNYASLFPTMPRKGDAVAVGAVVVVGHSTQVAEFRFRTQTSTLRL